MFKTDCQYFLFGKDKKQVSRRDASKTCCLPCLENQLRSVKRKLEGTNQHFVFKIREVWAGWITNSYSIIWNTEIIRAGQTKGIHLQFIYCPFRTVHILSLLFLHLLFLNKRTKSTAAVFHSRDYSGREMGLFMINNIFFSLNKV